MRMEMSSANGAHFVSSSLCYDEFGGDIPYYKSPLIPYPIQCQCDIGRSHGKGQQNDVSRLKRGHGISGLDLYTRVAGCIGTILKWRTLYTLKIRRQYNCLWVTENVILIALYE